MATLSFRPTHFNRHGWLWIAVAIAVLGASDVALGLEYGDRITAPLWLQGAVADADRLAGTTDDGHSVVLEAAPWRMRLEDRAFSIPPVNPHNQLPRHLLDQPAALLTERPRVEILERRRSRDRGDTGRSQPAVAA